jgi:polysaccharide export outer membrane protein
MRTWKQYLLALVLLLVPFASHGGDYVIGEGDNLMISVWGEKDLSLAVKVRPDGKITLPAVGEVMAANTTPKTLQTVLTTKLKGVVKSDRYGDRGGRHE